MEINQQKLDELYLFKGEKVPTTVTDVTDLEKFYDHICKIYNNMRSSQTISKESTSQANGDGSGSDPVKDHDIVESA